MKLGQNVLRASSTRAPGLVASQTFHVWLPSRRRSAAVGFWLTLSALLLIACSCHRAAPAPSHTIVSSSARANIGFASRDRLLEHFQKHGAEFGAITIEEYLRQAQVLRDGPVGGDVLEAVRRDGVTTRFDRSTGAFIAFNPDGAIRTFFKPNTGETYFKRQQERGE